MMNLKTASAVNTVRARAEEFACSGTTKLTIWKKAYITLADADMRVLASPIHYYGLSSQLQSCLAGFHAITKLSKATKYVLILNSVDEDVAQAATLQCKRHGCRKYWYTPQFILIFDKRR